MSNTYVYVAMTKDAVKRRNWTFYEANKYLAEKHQEKSVSNYPPPFYDEIDTRQ
jgi:hypothetical protein